MGLGLPHDLVSLDQVLFRGLAFFGVLVPVRGLASLRGLGQGHDRLAVLDE